MMKNSLFLFCLVLLAAPQAVRASIAINEENFPDENFRAWLLSRPYGEDGELTSLEIRGVTSMYLYQMNIKSLKGIEVFTELKVLYCQNNQLTEFDVSSLTALEVLSCSDNLLTSLNVSDCKSLKDLNTSNNPLTKLDVSKCTNLEQLGCRNNQLTTLDVRRCKNLFYLICDHNQLTELRVSGNMALQQMYCSNNQLTTLDVSGCTALYSLHCDNNQLTRLDVSDCTKLLYFFCYHNLIYGEAMDALIASLPIMPNEDGRFYVYQYDADDKNICTYDQVAAALDKGWMVLCRIDDEYYEYEGMDPESVSDIEADKQDGVWYDLQGRRLNKSPRRGIYINNGRKIFYCN